jgi:hypothetical protein
VGTKVTFPPLEMPGDDRIDLVALDETLGRLTPDEVRAVSRFVELCELVDEMSPDEAAIWRGRLPAWREYLEIGDDAEPDA